MLNIDKFKEHLQAASVSVEKVDVQSQDPLSLLAWWNQRRARKLRDSE